MRDYTLIRSARKTLALELRPDGSLLVRAPARCPKRDIDRFVLEHEAWITAHLAKAKPAPPEPTAAQREEYIRMAQAILPEKVRYYAGLVGKYPVSIRITDARKRFGSCSSQKHICFSWRLMQYPEAAIDYVVVHELCHLWHMDHSPAFYDAVARVLPDWKERRALLKR